MDSSCKVNIPLSDILPRTDEIFKHCNNVKNALIEVIGQVTENGPATFQMMDAVRTLAESVDHLREVVENEEKAN